MVLLTPEGLFDQVLNTFVHFMRTEIPVYETIIPFRVVVIVIAIMVIVF